MSGQIRWHETGWEDYLYWLGINDRKTIKKINDLIKAIRRGSDDGLGKPELLRGDLSGWASRHIGQEHRLVYRVVGEDVEIIQCRWHY